jgi:predicted amidohydrolase YtcJ
LKAGFTADFAVLSGHPFEGTEEDLKNLTVLTTYKEGKQVYQA